MSKVIFGILFLFLASSALFSQVNFEKIGLQEALVKAKKENKKVFIDVYASWCGPCKAMDAKVFSNKEVGERMAKEYIALKIDREKSPFRKDLSNYYIKGYPTMLILDSLGLEIGRIYGGRSISDFNKELDTYKTKMLSPVNQAFQNMKSNPNDQKIWKESLAYLYSQFNTLSRHRLYDQFKKECSVYFEKFTPTQLSDNDDFTIFRQVALPLEHPTVQFYLTDSTEYGSYLHKYYLTQAFQKEVKNSHGDTLVLKDIEKRASTYYDYVFKASFGDVESKDYFLKEIFKEKPKKEEKATEEKEKKGKRKRKKKNKK